MEEEDKRESGSKVSDNIFASITNSQNEKKDVNLEEYQYLNLIQNIFGKLTMNTGASRAILVFKSGCTRWAKRSQHLDRWLPVSEGVAV